MDARWEPQEWGEVQAREEQGQRPPVQEEDHHPRRRGRLLQPGHIPSTGGKFQIKGYKDVNLLRRFMSDRAKIRARRVTGNDSQQQKEIALAIKNAREMALLPYANRVTTQRGEARVDSKRIRNGALNESDTELAPDVVTATPVSSGASTEAEPALVDAEVSE